MRLHEKLTGNRPGGRTVYTMQVDEEFRAQMFELVERARKTKPTATFAGIVRDLVRRELGSE